MSMQLKGKVALVTGAASGLGRAIVERFLKEGASVVALSRSEPQPDFSADAVLRFVPMTGDVRSSVDNERAVEVALERFGRLDAFVGNAGIYDNRKPLDSFTSNELDAAFNELFDVNVKGYMLGALAALPALRISRGSIIFSSSLSGAHAGFGGPLYVASKHAINGLTKQLALELSPHVRVNAVAAGYVPTGLRGVNSIGQGKNPKVPEAADLPLQVIGTPEDYASAYVFLASDACARIASGTILQLDGGAAVHGPRK
ncbi:SDR family oxidoreductase [Cupriavidus pinatubonensis]|uniref:SDR family NAD(P)-dependent oxidoreductase n=1 Tax=Cupriavidus pinatubonensis TaxID=248026 RepID=UPI001C730344|nr:SDR family NAD(P)-dependent oxidoreductase [Cupriavidus pinatubonensis]QYY30864.1 SDR family oxidoreductase [Cupriavidus pinatubonensis]